MRAYGKIILFGEHVVVYGYPALAAALSTGIVCHIEPTAQSKFTLSLPQIHVQASREDEGAFGQILRLLEEQIPHPHHYGQLVIHSEIPFKAGLGSSAALAVAMIRALLEWHGISWPLQKVNEMAYCVEKIFHGTPSGIDNTVATYGGLCLVADPSKYQMPEYISEKIVLSKFVAGRLPLLPQPIPIIVVNTQQERETKKLVEHVREVYQQNPHYYEPIFAAIGDFATRGYQMFMENRYQELGNMMDINHHHLQTMQVSSPALDQAWQDAKAAGACGAKLTGAGGGGCLIALAPGEEKRIMQQLEKKGWQCFVAEIG